MYEYDWTRLEDSNPWHSRLETFLALVDRFRLLGFEPSEAFRLALGE